MEEWKVMSRAEQNQEDLQAAQVEMKGINFIIPIGHEYWSFVCLFVCLFVFVLLCVCVCVFGGCPRQRLYNKDHVTF